MPLGRVKCRTPAMLLTRDFLKPPVFEGFGANDVEHFLLANHIFAQLNRTKNMLQVNGSVVALHPRLSILTKSGSHAHSASQVSGSTRSRKDIINNTFFARISGSKHTSVPRGRCP